MARKIVDWEAVEPQYRAGIKTLRELGTEYGVSHAAIQKKADKEGWTRDLKGKIQAQAEQLVAKSQVTAEVSKTRKVAEQAVIDANAQAIANVVTGHRRRLRRGMEITDKLLDELEAQTDYLPLLIEVGEMHFAPDERGNDKTNELYRKIIDGANRIDGIKKLSDTMKNFITLERQAYNIADDAGEKPQDALSAVLETIYARGSRLPIAK